MYLLRQSACILFALHAVHLHAQPIIDISWLPRAGEKVYHYELNYRDIPLAHDTGANVTWDFSWMLKKKQHPIDSFFYFNPGEVSLDCINDDVNLVSDNGRHSACYIMDENGLFLTESRFPADDTILHSKYSDFNPVLRTNKLFGEEWRDTVKYIYNNGKYKGGDSGFIHLIMYVHSKYDAYGTLKIQGNVYDSTVRIYKTSFHKDSIYAFHPVTGEGKYYSAYGASEGYYWYSKSIHLPVLIVIKYYVLYLGTDGLFDTLFTNTLAWVSDLSPSLGVPKFQKPVEKFRVYAGDDKIYVTTELLHSESVSYTLRDISGRSVTSGSLNLVPGTKHAISTRTFSKGIYILSLTTDKGEFSSHKVLLR